MRAWMLGIFGLVVLVRGDAPPATPPLAHTPTALVWKNKRVELTATAGQERAEAVFPFRNSGTHAVTITAIESSCGCTTARLTKSTFAPGEAGEIRALFEFEDRVGPQQKVLTVHTDDAKVATQLVLRVDIPETILIEPRVLQWSASEIGGEKSLLVHTLAAGIEVTGLDFDATKIEARLEKISRSSSRLTLRPLHAAPGYRQTVQIRVDLAGRPRTIPVYAMVR